MSLSFVILSASEQVIDHRTMHDQSLVTESFLFSTLRDAVVRA